MKVCVIGAGPAGLAAAFDLTRAGCEVVIYEAGPRVGGLAGGFREPRWEWSLEKYYHHWFETDSEILRLAEQIGVRDRILFPKPVTALYHEGRFYPFDSPLAVLKFPGIPLVDRLRFGLVGAYLRFKRNGIALERYTAHRWLKTYLGTRAYETLWEPMLEGKFGSEYYREVNMAWFWARIHVRTPRLGTFEGGFQTFFDLLSDRIEKQGGRIRLEMPVGKVEEKSGTGLLLVETAGREETFEKVLCTCSPGVLKKMVPGLPADYLDGLNNLKCLGAVVLILALDRPLGPGIYWYNLPKREGFPFLCLVEHTRFVSAEHFGGDHIVYCGDYLDPGHPFFNLEVDALLDEYLPGLQRINPDFSTDWIRKKWVFRDAYAQPVPFPDHSKNIPDLRTPIRGLYWASMSHVYPWDRGTNFAVEIGRRAAEMVLEGE